MSKTKIETAATQTAEEVKSAVQIATERAAELTEIYKSKGVFEIIPVVFRDELKNENIVGYFKEPTRNQKMAVLDRSAIGAYTVVEEILPLVFLAEESDPRFMSENQDHDSIHMGFLMAVYDRIKFKPNTAKKKI